MEQRLTRVCEVASAVIGQHQNIAAGILQTDQVRRSISIHVGEGDLRTIGHGRQVGGVEEVAGPIVEPQFELITVARESEVDEPVAIDIRRGNGAWKKGRAWIKALPAVSEMALAIVEPNRR